MTTAVGDWLGTAAYATMAAFVFFINWPSLWVAIPFCSGYIGMFLWALNITLRRRRERGLKQEQLIMARLGVSAEWLRAYYAARSRRA